MVAVKSDVLILGAGISGLAAAKKAREAGRDALILEARDSAGGILDSFSVGGFTFDNAVHLSFATETEVREVFDQTPYLTHVPQAFAWEEPSWLRYPVQNNLFGLPVEDRADLLQSYIARPSIESPRNYYEWLISQFGHAFVERFARLYTRKYWRREPEELSTTWIGPRVRSSDLREILLGALMNTGNHYYYTSEMRYPEVGGYKAFIQTLISDSNIHTGKRVNSISPARRTVVCADGSTYIYERLVSTLPLPMLPGMIAGVDPLAAASGERLSWTSVDLISIALPRGTMDRLWFYIYDEDIFAARAYSPSVKSRTNAPLGADSIQFEVYHDNSRRSCTLDEAKRNCLYALEKMGICAQPQASILDAKTLRFANVTFFNGMEDVRANVRRAVDAAGIDSVGRFGEWDYLWSNQSFMSGYTVDFSR